MQQLILNKNLLLIMIKLIVTQLIDVNLFIVILDQFISEKFYMSMLLCTLGFYNLLFDFNSILFKNRRVLMFLQITNLIILLINKFMIDVYKSWMLTQLNYNYIFVFGLLYNYCCLYNKKFSSTSFLYCISFCIIMLSYRHYSFMYYFYMYNYCYETLK